MAAPRFRDFAERTGEMIHVDPRAIAVEEGHNPRDFSQPGMAERLEELTSSIAAQGVINPVWVRIDGGKLVLVDGESRLKATMLAISKGAEIKTIPAIKVMAANAADRKLLALTANTGKPLEKWEAGAAYKQLFGWGWSYDAIAQRVGVSPRYVGEAIELADTPVEVRAMMARGEITPRLALKEVRANGHAAVQTLAVKVQAAKADGKATAKAERKNAPGKLEDVCRAIMEDCGAEVWANEKNKNTADFFEHISVRHGMLLKLFSALNQEQV